MTMASWVWSLCMFLSMDTAASEFADPNITKTHCLKYNEPLLFEDPFPTSVQGERFVQMNWLYRPFDIAGVKQPEKTLFSLKLPKLEAVVKDPRFKKYQHWGLSLENPKPEDEGVYRAVLALMGSYRNDINTTNVIMHCMPRLEIIGSDSSASCRDLVILDGNFQSVTFKVTEVGGNFKLDKSTMPSLKTENNDTVCELLDSKNECTSHTVESSFTYTCSCENITGDEYHLTYSTSFKAPYKAYKVSLQMTVLNVSNKLETIRTDDFVIKQVREKRNCWVPTIEILNTAESASCSHDYLVAGTDYQKVTFNISWSNSDYLIHNLDTPTVVNSSSGGNLCPLEAEDNECLLKEFGDYSCFCEEITPDEHHLTFTLTPEQTGNGFPIHMKWRGQNGADDIISEKYNLKEVKSYSETDCSEEETWTSAGLVVCIVFGALIVIAGCIIAHKFGPSMRTAPTDEPNEAGGIAT